MMFSLGGLALVAAGTEGADNLGPTVASNAWGLAVALVGLCTVVVTSHFQVKALRARVDDSVSRIDAAAGKVDETAGKAERAEAAANSTRRVVEPASRTLSDIVHKLDTVAAEASAARDEAALGRRESAELGNRIMAALLDHANGPAHRGR